MNKRIISIFLSLVMGISTLFCANSFAFAATATEYTSGNYKYTIIDAKKKTIEIIRFNHTEDEENVYIPETLDGYTVQSIGITAFRDSSGIKSITIPSSVKNILCSFDSFDLQEIIVDSNNAFFSSVDGVLYDKSKEKLIRVPYDYQVETFTVPDSVRIIGSYAFYTNKETMLHINIPEGVEELEDYAFYRAGFIELVFPDSLRKIGNYTFNGCYACSIYFGSGLAEIGKQMFISQSGGQTLNLKCITVSPANPIFSSVDGVFFGNCGKDLIVYPQKKKDVDKYKVPDSVTYIHSCAFQHKTFEELDLNNVTKIGDYAFTNATVYKFIIPECLNEFSFYVMQNNCEFTVLNPNCVLKFDFSSFRKNFSIIMKGYNNSTAEEFVKNNTDSRINYTFESLGDYVGSGNKTPTSNHKYVDVVIKPTCINEGYTKYVCTSCGDTYNDHYVEPLGHSPVIDNEIPVSCLSNGLTQGSHCSRCNKVLVEQIEIKALGHSMDDGVIKTNPTCTKNGEKVFSCRNCSYSYGISIASIGHKYIEEIVNPDCTNEGYTKHTCSMCGDTYKDDYKRALGHNIVEDYEVPVGCVTNGLTKGSHCFRCNKVIVEQVEIKASGHSMDDGVIKTSPTCAKNGEQVFSCKNCNYSYSVSIPSIGHKYIEEIVKPDCTNKGYTKHTCSRCGNTYKDNYKNELGHSIITDKAVAATCTKSGLTQGSHCSRCNKVIVEQVEIKASGHSMNNGVIKVKATCTNKGTKVFSCKNCDYSYNVSISATGHKYKSKTTKATLTKAGSAVSSCSTCGNVKSKSTIAKIKSVTISKKSLTYTGKNLSKPTVTVKDSKGNKISTKYYTVKYISRSTGKAVSSIKNIGQYKLKVTFKGNYSGEKYLYFSVKPKKITAKAPSTGSKYVTSKWTKDNSISGYQVVIATDSKFSKNVKTVTIKKNSTASYKFTKLKKGKKYYIKVRSYKTIKVDGRTAKMYSDYSAVKSIKCK